MKKIKKTVIITGYECNNLCGFCYNLDKRNLPNKTTLKIFNEIGQARKRGTTYLEIIGGEQTIRPDIIEIVRYAGKLKFDTIAMATNGRMLSYKKFAQAIVKAGLNHIIFSVHGHNAKLHDLLTGIKGSFDQTLTGLENVKKIGLKHIGSNTTIVKQNYKYLVNIGRLLYRRGIRNSEFIFADPTRGGTYKNFRKFIPRISKAATYIRSCLDIGEKNSIEHWHVRYVPLCHFQGYENRISEIHEQDIMDTEHVGPDFVNLNVEKSRREVGRMKPAKCKKCKENKKCEGVWKEYYRRFGDKELKPIK